MPETAIVRIGTRASRLALWQASRVVARLSEAWPDRRFDVVPFETTGDRLTDVPLPRIGDRGVFTRDIEQGLESGVIDLAVHSLKDLPTGDPAGLTIGAMLEREDPRDALVSRTGARLVDLPRGARVGTSSLRRRAQLLALRPDLIVADIRGNVPTRVEKIQRGEYDATLLAVAGLRRLHLESHVAEIFEPEAVVSAPGQGALAVQMRSADADTAALAAVIDDPAVRLATLSERTVLSALRGGCQAPLGALAVWTSGRLRLRAVVADVEHPQVLHAETEATVADRDDAITLGRTAAEDLRRQGADRLLDAAREWVSAGTAGWGR